MKMYEAGLTRKEMYGEMDMPVEATGSSKKAEEKKIYPHLELNSKQFPEIENMKVGKKFLITIEVKPTRFSINDGDPKGEAKASMCFEISRIGMADDQEEGMEKDEKMDKMVEKMYPEKKEEKK